MAAERPRQPANERWLFDGRPRPHTQSRNRPIAALRKKKQNETKQTTIVTPSTAQRDDGGEWNGTIFPKVAKEREKDSGQKKNRRVGGVAVRTRVSHLSGADRVSRTLFLSASSLSSSLNTFSSFFVFFFGEFCVVVVVVAAAVSNGSSDGGAPGVL